MNPPGGLNLSSPDNQAHMIPPSHPQHQQHLQQHQPLHQMPQHQAPPLQQPAPAGMPYIGARISLISSADIRYEGILIEINTNDSTLTLQSVRSYGTEGRRPGAQVPSTDSMYNYIVFRGADIKDLQVLNTQPILPHPYHLQPQPQQATQPQQYPPQHYGQFPHPGQAHIPPPQMHYNPNLQKDPSQNQYYMGHQQQPQGVANGSPPSYYSQSATAPSAPQTASPPNNAQNTAPTALAEGHQSSIPKQQPPQSLIATANNAVSQSPNTTQVETITEKQSVSSVWGKLEASANSQDQTGNAGSTWGPPPSSAKDSTWGKPTTNMTDAWADISRAVTKETPPANTGSAEANSKWGPTHVSNVASPPVSSENVHSDQSSNKDTTTAVTNTTATAGTAAAATGAWSTSSVDNTKPIQSQQNVPNAWIVNRDLAEENTSEKTQKPSNVASRGRGTNPRRGTNTGQRGASQNRGGPYGRSISRGRGRGGYPGRGGQIKVSIPKEDFDFESMNEKLDKTHLVDQLPEEVAHVEKKYDKSSSFFDSLSSEKDGSMDASQRRKMLEEQKKLDMDTFGETMTRNRHRGGGNKYRGGGGSRRGGYRGEYRGVYNRTPQQKTTTSLSQSS